LQPDHRLHERDAGALEVQIGLRRDDGHPFLGAFLRRLGSSHVDVLRALGDLCEHGDTVRKDFDESEGDSEIKLFLADAVPQLADLQTGQQRRVPRA
jgi:hypothetical protein